MSSSKAVAGSQFPEMTVQALDGSNVELGALNGGRWKMVVVYRGRHCPLCTKYLNTLESFVARLAEEGVDLVAVSADSRTQLQDHLEKLNVSFPLYHGLTIEQMQTLGVYISYPRSEKETDHPFAEPGLFVINQDHEIQCVDLSNNPFIRPEIESIVSGLEWIRDPDNNYPIRGTYP